MTIPFADTRTCLGSPSMDPHHQLWALSAPSSERASVVSGIGNRERLRSFSLPPFFPFSLASCFPLLLTCCPLPPPARPAMPLPPRRLPRCDGLYFTGSTTETMTILAHGCYPTGGLARRLLHGAVQRPPVWVRRSASPPWAQSAHGNIVISAEGCH